jgi:phosphoglycolate phosphatase
VSQARPDVRSVFVLWDVDHTLIENNGVNKETYAKAFELLARRPAEHRAETEGRTDPEIMQKMLANHGIAMKEEYLGRIPQVLETAMLANVSQLRARGYALPGARAALEALHGRAGIVQSVLTGNIRPNAFTKLSVFGLDTYLDFEIGGYGSDDSVRPNLVAIARRRAAAKTGILFDEATTVVIGDTPRDVQVGRDGGAHVIAVASGSDSMERLRDEGAKVVLADLRDTDALVKAVLSFQS